MKRLALIISFVAVWPAFAAGQSAHPSLLGIGGGPPSEAVTADDFFNDSVVHEVRLRINSRDWQTLKDHFDENTYYPCDFQWRDQTVRNIGIRSRGSGSRNPFKPGLRVDFDRYSTDQTFLGLKSVILRNLTQEGSNMNERLSMLLFRRVGLLASREAHTKLFVNDDYVGIYTIVESIDKGFLKRNLGEDQGYLYEYDHPGFNYLFENLGSDSSSYVPSPFKPETHESDPHGEVIADFVETINETSDSAFRSAIAEFVDLEKFLRHIAVETFLADNDGVNGDFGLDNFYFYRPTDRKQFAFIAWDKSEAFSDEQYSIFHNINDVPEDARNRLLSRALSYDDLYGVYLNALMDCVRSASETDPASGDPRGWLEREVDREYNQIRDAAYADTLKPFTNDDFETAIAGVRSFARSRASLVTDQVNNARARRAPVNGASRDIPAFLRVSPAPATRITSPQARLPVP